MNNNEFDELLSRMLKRRGGEPGDGDAAVARIMARLNGPLPRQRIPFWRWPTVLLDWQFAPAWPRMAALAGCLALGFAIGLSSLDNYDPFYGARAPRNDLASVVFGPEVLSGAQP